jgi:hypothetical protein
MPNESAFPKSLMAAALSAAFPGLASAQTAARIDFAAGNVTASTPDGRSRSLTRGSEVQVGETVSTQQGRAQMRFTDGAYVSLQPQTDFKIDNYVFDGRGSPNESAVMSLLKGGMRTITGLIGRTNRDGYRLQTATATVGIRGTGYSVTYDAGGSVTIFVAEGATTVTNQAGTTTLPSGKSANVSGPNSPPSTSDEKPFLPPPGSGNTNVAGPQNPTQDAQAQLPAGALLTGEIVNTDSNIANLAYSNYSAGVNAIAAQPAILNAQGILTSFQGPSQFEGSGSAQLSLAGNDGVIAWGRWIGGTTSIGNNLDSSGPYHYVVGLPVTSLPTTGTASYTALGATASCYSGCTSAVVTGSTLAVTFGPTSVNGNFTLGMNIDSTPNNFFGTLFGGGAYSSAAKFTANSSGGGLSFYGQGFFAGPAASRAGMAYEVYGSIVEGPSIQVNGVVAYKKQ